MATSTANMRPKRARETTFGGMVSYSFLRATKLNPQHSEVTRRGRFQRTGASLI